MWIGIAGPETSNPRGTYLQTKIADSQQNGKLLTGAGSCQLIPEVGLFGMFLGRIALIQ